MPAAAIRADHSAGAGTPGETVEHVAVVSPSERRYHPLVRVITTEDIARFDDRLQSSPILINTPQKSRGLEARHNHEV